MIAYLKGRVIYRDNEKSSIILEVNGVGYEVFMAERSETSGSLSLFIYTYIREDRITLYGFRTSLQREIFSLLLEVKDVGPKLAVTVLSGIDSNNFLNILTTQDISALSQIKGIGKAKAERIIMELKNKILKKPALISDIKAEDICNYNYKDIGENKHGGAGLDNNLNSVDAPTPHVPPATAGKSLRDFTSTECESEAVIQRGAMDNNLNFTDASSIILESSCALEALRYSKLESFNLASKVYTNIIKGGGITNIDTEILTKECLRYIYSLKNI